MLVKLIKEKVQNEIEDIFSPENEKKLVKLINDNVNIPIFNEKHEEVIFTELIGIFRTFAKKLKK